MKTIYGNAKRGRVKCARKLERYFKPCKEHGKKAQYCSTELRWICKDCVPYKTGRFTQVIKIPAKRSKQ